MLKFYYLGDRTVIKTYSILCGNSGIILLPGRSYGNQDMESLRNTELIILLPGRSYGNQDPSHLHQLQGTILLPGRSYGNQDYNSKRY